MIIYFFSNSPAVPLFLEMILSLWIISNDAPQMMRALRVRKVRVRVERHRSTFKVLISSTPYCSVIVHLPYHVWRNHFGFCFLSGKVTATLTTKYAFTGISFLSCALYWQTFIFTYSYFFFCHYITLTLLGIVGLVFTSTSNTFQAGKTKPQCYKAKTNNKTSRIEVNVWLIEKLFFLSPMQHQEAM